MAELLFLIVTLGFMYLLLVRPQQQRVKRHQQLISELQVGDEVLTAGGILGKITSTTDDKVTVQIASGTEVEFIKPAVTQIISRTNDAQSTESSSETEQEKG